MPSRDKSVKDVLVSSFSQEIFEKSASTVAVLGNTVAFPPQKPLNTLVAVWLAAMWLAAAWLAAVPYI